MTTTRIVCPLTAALLALAGCAATGGVDPKANVGPDKVVYHSKSRFIPEATYVPSGVAEIARLQQREGYAYIRP